MNAITYFKLRSPYEGDVTKNCALSGSEVDNNFFTLEGRDIKSVELVDDKITINLINGEKLTTGSLTENCVKDLAIDFDEVNGILTITHNGITQTISGFATDYNIAQAAAVDGTIIGNGLPDKPLGISPVYKTGQYKPVKTIIDRTNNEKLPSRKESIVGDRFLTIENVNDYGYLYNYNGLKRIACQLNEIGSEWRIPTKQDWDDMLNAIEPVEEDKNHADPRSNTYLGRFAGKFLKSKDGWKKESNEQSCEDETCFDYTEEAISPECNCNKPIKCHPNYCGEYGSCRHRCHIGHNGIDKYGFRILPSGYSTEAKDYLYFNERAYFWTASNHDYRDAYIKVFSYNKSNVLQDIFASDNYLSVRLVKDFNGENYRENEEILGGSYPTVLMPSVSHGKAIWTSVNLSVTEANCDCHGDDFVLPNNGEGMSYTKKYFINEWNGKEWLKKEVSDGESVVVINYNDKTHTEYRVVNGELCDVANIIYNEVMAEVTPQIKAVTDQFDTINERIDLNENRIATVNENLVTSVNTINQNMADGFNTINENVAQGFTTINGAIDALRQEDGKINQKIGELEEKDNSIEGRLIIQDGSAFDKDNGVLSLKSNDGSNDISIQLNFNFGSF